MLFKYIRDTSFEIVYTLTTLFILKSIGNRYTDKNVRNKLFSKDEINSSPVNNYGSIDHTIPDKNKFSLSKYERIKELFEPFLYLENLDISFSSLVKRENVKYNIMERVYYISTSYGLCRGSSFKVCEDYFNGLLEYEDYINNGPSEESIIYQCLYGQERLIISIYDFIYTTIFNVALTKSYKLNSMTIKTTEINDFCNLNNGIYLLELTSGPDRIHWLNRHQIVLIVNDENYILFEETKGFIFIKKDKNITTKFNMKIDGYECDYILHRVERV